MQISDLFKKIIADTFYDKELKIMTTEKETIRDEEGSVIESKKDILKETLIGNFQFSTVEKIQQEYGKEIVANCIVTCDKTQATVDDILVYSEKEYEIKAIIPSDSHTTILLYRETGDENG